mmetsp:Transcript_15410/g.23238  ORF Transcript_15410/g.23238 Transcript_15410/m.23238 type:complete len:301 (-) Transcript_15410:237-1139(-)
MLSFLKEKFRGCPGSHSSQVVHDSGMRDNNVVLLLIDPQMDFHPGGSLAVPGANEDSERTAKFIKDNMNEIDEIVVTLDTHHAMHIAHGKFWVNSDGQHPDPFTLITYKDVVDGVWAPRDHTHLEHCKYYTKSLEEKGRFVLCIWPEHCLIGTTGHAVHPDINSSLQEWATTKMDSVTYVHKGMNCLTEMYSAVLADVPIPADTTTHLNRRIIEKLHNSRTLVVCGQALSHCVNFTVRDIMNNWRNNASTVHLLTDASSSVPTFESAGEEFVKDMKAMGVTCLTCAEMSDKIQSKPPPQK